MKRLEQCLAACNDPESAGRLRVAGSAALAAGTILRRLFDTPVRIEHKGAIDLVTEADLAAEKEVLAFLRQAFPHDAMLSEESSGRYDGAPEGPVWIVDPLDGTTNFAHSFPWFAVSIAYAQGAQSKVGVVYAPMQDELFCACHGRGAWLNGRPIRVSGAATLRDALLATGFPYSIREKSGDIIAALSLLLPKAQGLRRAGAAALDLAYVACGRLDGFWETELKPWDTAAGVLLVSEAGGAVSDYQGNPQTPYVPEIIASNGKIHHDLVGDLRKFSRRP